MNIIIDKYIPWIKLLKVLGLNHLQASKKAHLSRTTWQKLTSGSGNVEIQSLAQALQSIDLRLTLIAHPSTPTSDFSTVAVGYKTLRDGPSSWKIHFMDFIDEFRRSLDPRLCLVAPPLELPIHLRALMAAMVKALCSECEIDVPDWARLNIELQQPWFVSEMESLKASALLESPLPFRQNSIFVNANFMERV
jgi:hypothetical protein